MNKFLSTFGVLIVLLTSSLLFNAKCTQENKSIDNSDNETESFVIDDHGPTRLGACGRSVLVEKNSKYEEHFIFLNSIPVGCIAVNVRVPNSPRYGKQAPQILNTPVFFTPSSYSGIFKSETPDLYMLGAIEFGVLLPSRCIFLTNGTGKKICSQGDLDRGGDLSQTAMFAVMRYMLGNKRDSEGLLVKERFPSADTSNVGAYAFSHPGMLLNVTIARYGKYLDGLSYVGMRENPTQASFAAVELGDVLSGNGCNPLYDFSQYNSSFIELDYSSIQWRSDEELPYFDLDGDKVYDSTKDFSLHNRMPQFINNNASDLNLYSYDLLKDLENNLGSDVNLLKGLVVSSLKAKEFWDGRVTLGKDSSGNPFNAYNEISAELPSLKQMIIFSKRQHVQSCDDAPSVHQAHDGYLLNNMWTRLNPDEEYLKYSIRLNNVRDEKTGEYLSTNKYKEVPANFDPPNWENGSGFGYDSRKYNSNITIQAALAELMDRTFYKNWDIDLDGVLLER